MEDSRGVYPLLRCPETAPIDLLDYVAGAVHKKILLLGETSPKTSPRRRRLNLLDSFGIVNQTKQCRLDLTQQAERPPCSGFISSPIHEYILICGLIIIVAMDFGTLLLGPHPDLLSLVEPDSTQKGKS